jgi:hypothetical protein
MRSSLAVAAFLLLASGLEATADVRADHMAEMCAAVAAKPATDGLSRTHDNGFCRGLFAAVEQIVDFGDAAGAVRHPVVRVCRPKDWMRGWGDRTGQDILIAVFVRYVGSLSPARRQEAFVPIAVESFERAFPCGAQQQKK